MQDSIMTWLKKWHQWTDVKLDGAWITGTRNGKPVYMSMNDAIAEWKCGK